VSTPLPDGVRVRPLATHADNRGNLTELLRLAWHDSPPPVQWIASESERNVMRGVHVHIQHWDYLFLLQGEMLLGLHDMRLAASTYRRSATLRLRGSPSCAVLIPPGVAHGFYYPERSLHVLGTSTYWDTRDDLSCKWNCPELGMEWPCTDPLLSARDREAGNYAELAAQLSAR
jgi:dTDP-4-dehydrorhamnose 3,5-epimerase